MSIPVVYHGNLFVSGVISGSTGTNVNPVRRVADGSINLAYTFTQDVSPSLHSGSVVVVLASAQVPDSITIPKCEIPSGFTLVLETASGVLLSGTPVVSATFSSTTVAYKADLPSGTAASSVWRLVLSGVSGLVPAKVYEVELANKQLFPRAAEVGIRRDHDRQFTRIPVPGGQPFVKRDGPKLRGYSYSFRTTSGTETSGFRSLLQALEGGGSFYFQDDLGECYWAEMPQVTVTEEDSAGVSTWNVQVREVKVD